MKMHQTYEYDRGEEDASDKYPAQESQLDCSYPKKKFPTLWRQWGTDDGSEIRVIGGRITHFNDYWRNWITYCELKEEVEDQKRRKRNVYHTDLKKKYLFSFTSARTW